MTKRWHTAVGVLLTAVMLFPSYWMVNVSLTPAGKMRKSPPDFSPTTLTFDGYVRVLREQLPYFGTSLLIASATVVLTLSLAAPAAYSLAKLRPRGRRTLQFALLVAQMIPGIIMALGFYGIYVKLGITNTVWA
jgi:multiple sugar transport system permease protein